MKKRFVTTLMPLVMACSMIQGQQAIPSRAYWLFKGTSSNSGITMNLVKIADSVYADVIFNAKLSAGFSPETETRKPVCFGGKVDSKGSFWLKPFGSELPLITGILNGSETIHVVISGKKDAGTFKTELSEQLVPGSVQFNVYNLSQRINLVRKPKSPSGNLSMAMLSPIESGDQVISDTLKRIIFGAFGSTAYHGNDPDTVLQRNLAVFKRDYLNGNLELYRQMPDAGILNWELLKFMHVVNNENYLLSFYILSYAFSGGAHGLGSLDYLNIDLKKGRILVLDDILNEGKKQELSLLLTKKLKRMNVLAESQKLTEIGYFTDEIQPNNNFYLCPGGIGFVYNHYDIAPYSFGPSDIFLSADEVKGILRSPFLNF